MTATTTHNPHYGQQGKPYTVVIGLSIGEARESYWTKEEAYEARDRAFDAGFTSVRILGLPTVTA